jgi:hypothetical protein
VNQDGWVGRRCLSPRDIMGEEMAVYTKYGKRLYIRKGEQGVSRPNYYAPYIALCRCQGVISSSERLPSIKEETHKVRRFERRCWCKK